MKIRILIVSFLSLMVALGCATSPKKERTPLPSQKMDSTRPPSPSEERLTELVIPQREETKTIPEKLYSFFARDSNVQDVLLALSRESEFNIVIDPGLSGKVTIDLKRVTLREALDAILPPLGWTYHMEGRFVKVLRPQMETRLFTLNYIATKRTGKREVYASTGGGLQTGGLQTTSSQTAGQTTTVGSGMKTGYSDLVSTDEMDLWKEIQKGLETIIFSSADEKEQNAAAEKTVWTRTDERGRKLIVNKSTGVILAMDYPINLNKVASYIERIEGSSQRQVTIQAKILEVLLTNDHKEGINWKTIQSLPRFTNLAWGLTDSTGKTGFPGGIAGFLTGTGIAGAAGSSTIPTPGTFHVKPFGGILAIGPAGTEVLLSDIIQAISEQGDVKMLSSPTISTLNNQKAIIRVANQDVFFITGAVATQSTVTTTVQPMTIDIGIILDVTPQIGEDGTITMNIHPSISEKTGEKLSPDGKTTFPLLSVRETDTTVRVRDGQTIIIAGLMQEKSENTHIGVPFLQSAPVIGPLFRYKTETKRNVELVIMITPTLEIGKRVDSGRAN